MLEQNEEGHGTFAKDNASAGKKQNKTKPTTPPKKTKQNKKLPKDQICGDLMFWCDMQDSERTNHLKRFLKIN